MTWYIIAMFATIAMLAILYTGWEPGVRWRADDIVGALVLAVSFTVLAILAFCI